MKGVKISVIMPMFNARSTVATAIKSILAQTIGDWELIVMDDGSRDGSREIVSGFCDRRITLVAAAKNSGIVARLNEGVAIARGKFIARMDADDIAYPARFERQLLFLERTPKVDLIGSRILIFDGRSGRATGAPVIPSDHEGICARLWDSVPLPHPTWFARTDWFKANRYSDAAPLAEDQELLLRTSHKSQFYCLPDILLAYRQDGVTLSKEVRSRVGYIKACLRTDFLRRRPATAAAAAGTQAAKVCLAAFACATGTQRNLLRRRSAPVSQTEASQWAVVWRSMQGS